MISQTDAERLLIEGEDIQNIYFIRSSAGPKQPLKSFILKHVPRRGANHVPKANPG